MVDYWSKERERIGSDGPPCWLGWQSVIPSLTVTPAENDRDLVRVGVWLPSLSYRNSYSEHSFTLEVEHFPTFMREWLADPEATLETRFGYTLPEQGRLNSGTDYDAGLEESGERDRRDERMRRRQARREEVAGFLRSLKEAGLKT